MIITFHLNLEEIKILSVGTTVLLLFFLALSPWEALGMCFLSLQLPLHSGKAHFTPAAWNFHLIQVPAPTLLSVPAPFGSGGGDPLQHCSLPHPCGGRAEQDPRGLPVPEGRGEAPGCIFCPLIC